MNSTRGKRNRAARRLKRAVMQNHMVLRGWAPVQLNAQWGIYNHSDNRLVLRKWLVPDAAAAKPSPMSQFFGLHRPPGGGRWSCECIQLTAPFNGSEVVWNDIQLRWVHELRSAALQRGWL